MKGIILNGDTALALNSSEDTGIVIMEKEELFAKFYADKEAYKT